MRKASVIGAVLLCCCGVVLADTTPQAAPARPEMAVTPVGPAPVTYAQATEPTVEMGRPDLSGETGRADDKCPADTTQYNRELGHGSHWIGLQCDVGANEMYYEDFEQLTQKITGVSCWGGYAKYSGAWTGCTEADKTFTLTFYGDNNNAPNPADVKYTETKLATVEASGYWFGPPYSIYIDYATFNLTTHQTGMMNGHYWFSMQAATGNDPNCWWLQFNHDTTTGAENCWTSQNGGTGLAQTTYGELAYCILTLIPYVRGACCNTDGGFCSITLKAQCLNPGYIFYQYKSCYAGGPPFSKDPNDPNEPNLPWPPIFPDCGKGSCCNYVAKTCTDNVTQAQCYTPNNQGKIWRVGATCADGSCCFITCPPNATQEGEDAWFGGRGPCDTDVDLFNSACGRRELGDPTPYLLQDINCGETICGTSSTYYTEEPPANSDHRDNDWFPFEITAPKHVIWQVYAEFPVEIGIVRPVMDCNLTSADFLVTGNAECGQPCIVEYDLEAGTWWLYVRPYFAVGALRQGLPCNGNIKWFGELFCQSVELGACCDDGICVGTLAEFQCLRDYPLGTWHAGQTCPGYVCPESPTGACCDQGTCIGTMTERQCVTDNNCRTWYEGESCGDPNFECPTIVCAEFEPNAPHFNEGETCGQDTNGGCNSTPNIFTNITCGQVVCGIAWADGGTRDTDWYKFTLTATKYVTWGVAGELPMNAYIITSPCGSHQIIAAGHADPYTYDQASAILGPGTYYAWAGTGTADAGIFEGYPCDTCNDYVGYLRCLDPCSVTCTGTPEGEGDPCTNPQTNPGCNGNPPVFQPIAIPQTYCGTSGIWDDGTYRYRDTDWYKFTLAATTSISAKLTAEFEPLFMLMNDPLGDCNYTLVAGWVSYLPCNELEIAEALGPGIYYLFVAPRNWDVPVPCNADYKLVLAAGGPTPCPGDFDCDGDRDFGDIDYLVAALGGEQAWKDFYASQHGGQQPPCTYAGNCDLTGDGVTTFADIDPFVGVLGQPCP